MPSSIGKRATQTLPGRCYNCPSLQVGFDEVCYYAHDSNGWIRIDASEEIQEENQLRWPCLVRGLCLQFQLRRGQERHKTALIPSYVQSLWIEYPP